MASRVSDILVDSGAPASKPTGSLSALLLPSGAHTVLHDRTFVLVREDGWRLPEMQRTGVRFAAAGGGVLYVFANDGRLLRWNAATKFAEGKSSAPAVVEIESKDARLDNMFVDDTGGYAIFTGLSSMKGKSITLFYKSTVGRAREIVEDCLRGEKVEAVAWVTETTKGSKADTKHVLMGTASGLVILGTEDGAGLKCKQIWKLPDAHRQPIISLQVEKITHGSETKYFCMVVTGERTRSLRVFKFVSNSVDTIFAMGSVGGKNSSVLGFPEIPAPPGSTLPLDTPSFHWSVTTSGAPTAPSIMHYSEGPDNWHPDVFALTTHVGIYTGSLKLYPTVTDLQSTTHGLQMVPYPLTQGAVTRAGVGSTRGGGYDSKDITAIGGKTSSTLEFPLGMAITDYHFLLLYRQRLVAISRVTKTPVFEQSLPEDIYGVIRGMTVDTAFHTKPLQRHSGVVHVWIYSDRSSYFLSIDGEAEDVWKLYVLKTEFEKARELVGTSRSRMEAVNAAQAQYLMQRGEFSEAAKVWVKTSVPFEEICLKFIHAGATPALQQFVTAKLEAIDAAVDTDEDLKRSQMQQTILCTWLTEMFLHQLNALQQPALHYGGSASAAFEDASTDFRLFLNKHSSYLDKATTLALLSSHGRTEELLYYCKIMQDYDRIISFHIQSARYAEALAALETVPLDRFEELWYVYSPVLMQYAASATVNAWKATHQNGSRGLDPTRLIPAMVRYEQTRDALARAAVDVAVASSSKDVTAVSSPPTGSIDALGANLVDISVDHALRYLEWVVHKQMRGWKDRAVHNFLLSLYAKQPVESMLLDYIALQTADMRTEDAEFARAMYLAGDEGVVGEEELEDGLEGDASTSYPLFDLQYALRICLAEKKHKACVQLYTAIGLHEEAVDLALKMLAHSGDSSVDRVGLVYAKEAANACPMSERALRKKLWLRLASWVISHGGGVKQALEVLHDSDGVLRIEDLLVYFPDVTLIDEFKVEISQSLQECHSTIKHLREEMRGYQDAAERIRNDIRGLRNRAGFLRPTQKCELCARPLLPSHFYLFPCNHAFHRDCLLTEVTKHLTESGKAKLQGLVGELARVNGAAEALGGSDGGRVDRSKLNVSGSIAANASPAELLQALYRRRDRIQGDINQIIAEECLFCGDIMISSIAHPFENTGDWDV